MEFQVIDYAEEKLPLFLFLYQLDSADLHCQRAWISEAPALHQTGFSISGGQTQADSDSYRRKPGWKSSSMAKVSLSSFMSFHVSHSFCSLWFALSYSHCLHLFLH